MSYSVKGNEAILPVAQLGNLELPVLAAVARQNGTAYAVSVMRDLCEREKRDIAYATAHTVLIRLESKGLVSSRMGEPTSERGGRRKRLYEISDKGRAALEQSFSRDRQRYFGMSWLKPRQVEN
jgi:DNA-binding PadR family transcriptional regulator